MGFSWVLLVPVGAAGDRGGLKHALLLGGAEGKVNPACCVGRAKRLGAGKQHPRERSHDTLKLEVSSVII